MYLAKRLLFLQALLHFFLLGFCTSLHNITVNRSLKDGDVLLSTGEIFALGFFSLGKSSHRYVGIWYYKVPDLTYVWVANRDNPINDHSGVLSIDVNGDLVLHAKNGKAPIWSTNVTVSKPTNNTLVVAELLDKGCLTLFRDAARSVVLWQSFDHPTNTMLPYMKLGLDRRSGLNRVLTSWKSKDDPGTGNFSYEMDTNGSPQLFLYKNNVRWWRSGHWNGLGWSGIPTLQQNNFIFVINFTNNQDEVTTTWTINDPTIPSTLVVNESGLVIRNLWPKQGLGWTFLGERPGEQCEQYLKCGAFGTCELINGTSEFKCTCLPGFEPRSRHDWDLRNTSGGCVRKRGAVSICKNGEGFMLVRNLKLPDTSVALVDNSSLSSCQQSCLQNCSCTAYANLYVNGTPGCLKWHSDLLDARSFPEGGQDLFVRVDKIELGDLVGKSQGFFANKRKLAILIVLIAVTSVLILFSAYWLKKRQRKGSRRRRQTLYNNVIGSPTRFEDSAKLDESRSKPDLPFFELSTIIAATDNFSSDKKLGQGGFGPVYKGQLANGQEIAVKRLSRSSGQGIEEFKNEVMLIAKLQHRNLVRLFGCCIHREDKMLIYEYMPNKSLDFFIFDEMRRPLLDWRSRFDIIFGIARGVLYLHQDSRLKIIHRDLKASNVLLDAGMNPKISDFGMARMFGDDQIEASTNRVVGTYGYMSPEYAMEGLYSIKSDVFSYGVLALEIISGKRNNHFHVGSVSLNLTGHVWDLWMEGKAEDVVDSSFGEEYPTNQVLRCIHIGLLCVQERATDRPTMPEIVFMLGNETTLPSPKKPAFINRISPAPDSSISGGAASINDETMSAIEAR